MKLDELKRLCDEVPPTLGEAIKTETHGWMAATGSFAFWRAASTYMPRLIAVAEAADKFSHSLVGYELGVRLPGSTGERMVELNEALAALEE